MTSFSDPRNIDPATLEDEVIVRSNGMPNYNLTSIIDDAEMQITHVIRGTEHLNNTPKQIAIANASRFKDSAVRAYPTCVG